MIATFNQFKTQLTSEKLNLIKSHFEEIYECKTLTDHELKISYLAYLWKNHQVILTEDGNEILNETSLGIDMYEDYELTVETYPEDSGGVDLGIMHIFYNLTDLEKLV